MVRIQSVALSGFRDIKPFPLTKRNNELKGKIKPKLVENYPLLCQFRINLASSHLDKYC